MDKYHKKDIVGIERENERDERYKSKVNPQIDNAKTHNNYHVIGRAETYLSYIKNGLEKSRKNEKSKTTQCLSTRLFSDRTESSSLPSRKNSGRFFLWLHNILCRALRWRILCSHPCWWNKSALELNPRIERPVVFQTTFWQKSITEIVTGLSKTN